MRPPPPAIERLAGPRGAITLELFPENRGVGTVDRARPEGMCASPLLDRDRQLDTGIKALDDACTGHGRLLILDGPAGMGKTRLLDAIADRAAGVDLLRASGASMERGYAFGLVRDLFEPWLRAADHNARSLALAGPAERAAPVFATEPTAGPAPSEPGHLIRGLFQLTVNLAALRPLLIIVDDVHWADERSLRYLAYLGSHLGEMQVLVMLAWRPAEPGSADIGELLACGGDRLPVGPLSRAATCRLVEHLCPGCGGPLAKRCHMCSGGNPMFVVELCRALADERAAGPVRLAGKIGELAPAAVAESITRRLSAFGPAAMSLAEAVAVLGPDARVRPSAALAGLEPEHAARLGAQLADAGLLTRAEPLAFAAPILRTVVYRSIPPGQRSLRHAAAARLLAAASPASSSAAAHLLLSEPAGDPSAARVLRAAARQARIAGQPRCAARYLDRALAEPPPAAERGAVLLELGAMGSQARLPGAEVHLALALSGGGPLDRIHAALELADLQLLDARFSDATAVLEAALGQLDPGQPALAMRLRAELAACQTHAGAPRPSGWWAAGTAELAGTTQGERALLAVAAADAALSGEPAATTLAVAQRAIGDRALLGELGATPGTSMLALLALQVGEHLELTERHLDRELRRARTTGSVTAEAIVLTLRSLNLLVRGTLREAESHARAALAIGRKRGLGLLVPLALALLIEALLDQGRIADAKAEFAGCADVPGGLGHGLLTSASGQLHAACGDPQLGLQKLLTAGSSLLRAGCQTPSFDWRSRAGLLAHQLERPNDAIRLIDDELALAGRLGARRPLGMALRARALVCPPRLQIEILHEAVDLLRGTSARLDYARALCELGSALRRYGARGNAREPLREALQLAAECNALVLAERARHELIVLGARPRRHAVTGIEALTARERQASELAADGLTNRQIATLMSVTPNTIEYHLTNAYRKLGVDSRLQLTGALLPRGKTPIGAAKA
jgi:DNA-binding CsgD family transcriptional regulator